MRRNQETKTGQSNASGKLRKDFQRFLASGGYCTPPGRAACALSKAKTLNDWRIAEADGLVKIAAEPALEPYEMGDCDKGYVNQFGRHVSAKEANAEIEQIIDRDGVWCVVSYYHDGQHWVCADSIGDCLYARPLDPFCNGHVIDLMRAALDSRAAYVTGMAGAI